MKFACYERLHEQYIGNIRARRFNTRGAHKGYPHLGGRRGLAAMRTKMDKGREGA